MQYVQGILRNLSQDFKRYPRWCTKMKTKHCLEKERGEMKKTVKHETQAFPARYTFLNLVSAPKPHYMASKTTVGYTMTMVLLIAIASFPKCYQSL